MADLTVERLKEVLDYNSENGEFVWRISPANNVSTGSLAGFKHKQNGHVYIRLDGRRYLAHRLAWFYSYGEWPEGQIDHRNRIRVDNRLENLRQATPTQQRANARGWGKSGLKGISYRSGSWGVNIWCQGRSHWLGTFPTEEQARAAYMARAVEFFGEFACDGV